MSATINKLWPKVNKENPCPICNHADWLCRFGDKAVLCMRIESPKPAKDGGWYHFYDSSKPAPKRFIMPPRVAPKVNLDFEKLMELFQEGAISKVQSLSRKLGVDESSVCALECGFSNADSAYAIPMRDGDNKIIGIHLRCEDGSKKAVVSSRNGLFIPQINPQKVAFICEGASNTTALLTMGFYAIGRPSCNSGGELLKVALKRLGVSRIVIVADNDTIKSSPDGRTFRPGQDGSKKLKKELGLMSVIFTTPNPVKDVRQLLQKLGVESARNYIQNSVNQKIWTKI